MRTIVLVITAAAIAGCASARQERAAQFQRELPQLVAACNDWVELDPALDGPTIRRDGFRACKRLSVRGSLHLADSAAVSAYQRVTFEQAAHQAARDSGQRASYTYAIPMPLPQVQ